MKRGLIFTMSIFFVFVALFALLSALGLRVRMLEGRAVDDAAVYALRHARDDLARAVLRSGGVNRTSVAVSASAKNVTLLGNIVLASDFDSLLEDEITFYETYVKPKNHLDVNWINPDFRFSIEPHGTDMRFENGYVEAVTADHGQLDAVHILLSFPVEVDAIGSSPDDGEPCTQVSVVTEDPSGESEVSVCWAATDSNLLEIERAADSEVVCSVGYGRSSGVNGTFFIDSDIATLRELTFSYNNTGDLVWLETDQEIGLNLGPQDLHAELVFLET